MFGSQLQLSFFFVFCFFVFCWLPVFELFLIYGCLHVGNCVTAELQRLRGDGVAG